MKIIVMNPPFLDMYSRESRSPAVNKSGTLYYPMWLAYAVGYLEDQGHTVKFIDAPAEHLEKSDVQKIVREFSPRLVVSGSSTPSIYSDCEILAEIKKDIPQAVTVLVGVHVSAVPEQTLREAPAGVDAVAFGEYEETLLDLATTLEKKGESCSFAEIQGLAYKTDTGEVIKNPSRPFIEDLDTLPYVSRVYKEHLKSISPYFYGHSRHPLMVIVTGRGCPFHCTYCVIPQTLQGHKYRKRSIENIVGEFRYIAEEFPEVREIMIEDDTLTADRKRTEKLCDALIEEGLTNIPWAANSRAQVGYETLRKMKKAGCRLLCVGFESGDQQILDNIKKSITLDTVRKFRKDAAKAGVMVHGCFMFGNKGETRDTMEKTLRFAKELNPDTAQFYPIMAYPGTEAYEYFKSKGWVVSENYRNWIDEEGLHSSTVSNPELPYEELVAFCDHCRRKFYLRPGYMLMKLGQSIRHPEEGKRNIKGFLSLVKYLFRSSEK
ncbi:MAG: B12-binding domain-containing radical SAM protein [Fibrobacterota bacterium]